MATSHDLESVNSSEDNPRSPRDSVSLQEFITAIVRAFNALPVVPKQDRPAPKTWKDVHSPKYLPRPIDDLASNIMNLTTAVDDADQIFTVCKRIYPLAFLTIASGHKGKVSILHSLAHGVRDDREYTIGLFGTTLGH